MRREKEILRGRATPATDSGFAVFLDTASPDSENVKSFLFTDPVEVLRADCLDQVMPLLREAEARIGQGYWVAGALSYEAGFALQDRRENLVLREPGGVLARLGVFREPEIFPPGEAAGALADIAGTMEGQPPDSFEVDNLCLEQSRQSYLEAVSRAKEYIGRGDTYQVNYTTRYRFDFRGNPLALYGRLRRRQRVPYSAVVRDSDWWGLSLSPELFFRIGGGSEITARPMKGTARRGRTPAEDREFAARLGNDPKNRAENIMIVDLIRNDLGRVCETGSVKVDSMFDVERCAGVLQMTSTVRGTLARGTGFSSIMGALFPCGSITGAPKLRTMELIAHLEQSPRDLYTGSIGCFSPGGDACFNVAIRTVEITGDRGVLGVGGGIVADSIPEEEYRECLLKGDFLTGGVREDRSFLLIETMLFDGERIALLELHLERMRESAGYFGRPFDSAAARRAVSGALGRAAGPGGLRIRLLLDEAGEFTAECWSHEPLKGRQVVALHRAPVSSADPFLRHKTTRRELYDRALGEARERGLCDYLFVNELGQVTEGCITNIYAEKDGCLWTPPAECGLLPGVYRRWFMEEGGRKVREKIIYPDDLRRAERLWASNAVQGLFEVELAG